MKPLRPRMIDPSIANLSSLSKRALMTTLMQLCEESGCFLIDYREIRNAAFPRFENITELKVEEWLNELKADGWVWGYEIDGEAYGYLPQFHHWNSNLKNWHCPEDIPLPPGIAFMPYSTDDGTRKRLNNQGHYLWPNREAALMKPPTITPDEHRAWSEKHIVPETVTIADVQRSVTQRNAE